MFKALTLILFICYSYAGAELSLEEKAGQMLIAHFNGEEINEEARILIEEAHIGGIIYFNWSNGLRSPEQVQALSRSLQSKAKIPLWICLDQEGGVVRRLNEGFPYTLGQREIVAKSDDEQTERWAYEIGALLRNVGVNMNLAPVVDVSSGPQAYIAKRTFGDTPEIVTRYAQYALQGYQKANVLAVLKHFPGYGGAVNDPHESLPVIREYRIGLMPFERLSGIADAMMTAHVLIPGLDEANCATLSPFIIQNIVREKMGFKGLTITDSLVMLGLLDNCGSVEEAAIRAINAGCDILILGGKQLQKNQQWLELRPKDTVKIHKAIVEAVQNGRIPQQRIDEAVTRILEMKRKYV